MTTVEAGLTVHRYWDRASCRVCDLKPKMYAELRATGLPLGA